jgi:hypothetical protein
MDVRGEQVWVDALERRDLDGRRRPFRTHAGGMRAHAAGGADVIGEIGLRLAFRGPAIFDRSAVFLQPELVGGGEGEPGAGLAAQGTIAADRALVEVERGCVADRAAMASAAIILLCHAAPLLLLQADQRWLRCDVSWAFERRADRSSRSLVVRPAEPSGFAMKMREFEMRALILVAGAALTLSACGGNADHEDANVIDANAVIVDNSMDSNMDMNAMMDANHSMTMDNAASADTNAADADVNTVNAM